MHRPHLREAGAGSFHRIVLKREPLGDPSQPGWAYFRQGGARSPAAPEARRALPLVAFFAAVVLTDPGSAASTARRTQSERDASPLTASTRSIGSRGIIRSTRRIVRLNRSGNLHSIKESKSADLSVWMRAGVAGETRTVGQESSGSSLEGPQRRLLPPQRPRPQPPRETNARRPTR
jgi:hypothetical protein